MVTTENGISLVQVDEGIQFIKTGLMSSQWPRYFYQKSETEIHLCEDPSASKISISNIRLLEQTHQQFSRFTVIELREFFTNLPEYSRKDVGLPLTQKELLYAVELSEEDLRRHRNHYKLI
jgi:hypothetical protein